MWHIDEVFITIQGQRHYLWRAVDQDGDVLDILVQRRRNHRAAERFFRRFIKGQGGEPRWLITDNFEAMMRHIEPQCPRWNIRTMSMPTIGLKRPTDPRSTISDSPWTHAKTVSPRPPPDVGGQLPSVADSGVSGLE